MKENITETDLSNEAVKIAREGMPSIIVRRSHPTKLDHSPKGTLCLVKDEDGENTYRQMSDDEENPVWIEM